MKLNSNVYLDAAAGCVTARKKLQSPEYWAAYSLFADPKGVSCYTEKEASIALLFMSHILTTQEEE